MRDDVGDGEVVDGDSLRKRRASQGSRGFGSTGRALKQQCEPCSDVTLLRGNLLFLSSSYKKLPGYHLSRIDRCIVNAVIQLKLRAPCIFKSRCRTCRAVFVSPFVIHPSS